MIHRHTCNNGLRVVVEPMTTVRSVTIGIWVLTGSRNEHEQDNGISHFLEHMFFKGTKKRTARQIAEEFDAIGGHVNAFTSKEYTCFYAHVLDTYKDTALDILSDMFFDSTFPEDEIEREKKVVMEEIKMYEDTPDDHVHDLLAKAIFGNHPLGRPILGTEKQLNEFSKETLTKHIQTFYTPKNVVISIAGNVNDNIVLEVEKLFDRFQHAEQKINLQQPEFMYNTLHKSKETEQVHLCLGYKGLGIDSEHIPSMSLMNNILGGSMSSRLFQEVREKHGLAYSVFSYNGAYLDSGFLTIYAGTTKEQLNFLESTIDETINVFVQDGATEKELKNSKAQLKGNMMLRLEGTNSRMTRNGRNELLLGKHQSLDEVIEEIDSVTHEMIQEIINDTFSNKRALAQISPSGAIT